MVYFQQQGDVIVERIDRKKVNLKKCKKLDHGIVREGEFTGHKHLVCGGATLYVDEADRMYMEVEEEKFFVSGDEYPEFKENVDGMQRTVKLKNGEVAERTGTLIRHNTHKPQVIPPGIYFIDGVAEYDHFLEEARPVRD